MESSFKAVATSAAESSQRIVKVNTPPIAVPATLSTARQGRSCKLLEAGHIIDTTPPTGNEMAFNHAVLCQVCLPRSKVEGREFRRESGAMWINIQAGWLDEGRGPVAQAVAYIGQCPA